MDLLHSCCDFCELILHNICLYVFNKCVKMIECTISAVVGHCNGTTKLVLCKISSAESV